MILYYPTKFHFNTMSSFRVIGHHIKGMVSFGRSGAKNTIFGDSLSRPQIRVVIGLSNCPITGDIIR